MRRPSSTARPTAPIDLVEAVERHRAGVDGQAAGGLFAQLRDVHVAETGQHQGARDRGRGHHENVHRIAFLGEREPLVDAEAVLLVDDGQREVAEADLVLEQRMGADQEVDISGGEAVEDAGALAAALAAGEDRDAHAGGLGQRRDRLQMLAREDLGRRHQGGLAAGLDDRSRREKRDDGLAGADVALEQAEHALGLAEIGIDVGDRRALAPGQRERQRRQDLCLQAGVVGARAPAAAPHMGAHQGERELARQHLVIGKARPRRPLHGEIGRLRRPVQRAQGIAEARPFLAREQRRVEPLRQRRHLVERRRDGAAQRLGREPLGERVDRLNRRQARKAGFIDHEIGMHHLQHAVIERHGARHDAASAHRQQPVDMILARVEIGDDEAAGVVAGIDEIGRPRPVGRWRAVAVDRHRDGDDATGHDIAQHRPRPPVDGPGRQVEHEIDDARRVLAAEQPAIEPRDLVADARQRRDRREQGIEDTRTHGRSVLHRAEWATGGGDWLDGMARPAVRLEATGHSFRTQRCSGMAALMASEFEAQSRKKPRCDPGPFLRDARERLALSNHRYRLAHRD